jgi:hypothetical protein
MTTLREIRATPLNVRSRGWLRHLWDKATTQDDWSDHGSPHPWWDRLSDPPMCCFPRWDVSESAYALPVLLETTPAWREVYTRIADELVSRYLSFWGTIDWCTFIGPDPHVDRYPPQWLIMLPERLRGRYSMPGWTSNGVEPWGLQPDPIGSDGNLFYRGWLTLLMSIRQYVSGERTQDEPFEVAGYQGRRFSWTLADMARFMSAQFAARPQGVHCENTKIWPFCSSAATLGLKLYDTVTGENTYQPIPQWIDYVRTHYMKLTKSGELDWFIWYYDPIEERASVLPGPAGAYAAIMTLQNLYPQDPKFATRLYELAMRKIGWSNPSIPVMRMGDDQQPLAIALWMAREVGDTVTYQRLSEVVERDCRPRFFGEESDRFGFWFQFHEKWPRGQANATLMLTECGAPGAWSRAFNHTDFELYRQPTVCDVDYPRVGISLARNDTERRRLAIQTYAGTPSCRGQETAITVAQIPAGTAIGVTVDGTNSDRWQRTSPTSIRIALTVDDHDVDVTYGLLVT